MSSYFGTVEQVEAARAKRRKEVQAWARADQALADLAEVRGPDALTGVPTSFDQDWDLIEPDEDPIVVAVVEVEEPIEEPEIETVADEIVEPVVEEAPKTPKASAKTKTTPAK